MAVAEYFSYIANIVCQCFRLLYHHHIELRLQFPPSEKIVVAEAWVWLSLIFGVGLLVQPLHIALSVCHVMSRIELCNEFYYFSPLEFQILRFFGARLTNFTFLRFSALDKQEFQFLRFCDFALKKCKIYNLNAFSEFSLNTIA